MPLHVRERMPGMMPPGRRTPSGRLGQASIYTARASVYIRSQAERARRGARGARASQGRERKKARCRCAKHTRPAWPVLPGGGSGEARAGVKMNTGH
jgi:hypothetical protein